MKKSGTAFIRIGAAILASLSVLPLISCSGGSGAETTAAVSAQITTEEPEEPDEPEVKGMKWSDDRIIPKFDPPTDKMDALRSSELSFDEQVTFSTLQGIVNRTEARILIIDEGADEGGETWAKTFGVKYRVCSGKKKYQLCEKYLSEYSGVVLYSSGKSEHYVNLACSIANTKNALPMTKDLYDKLALYEIAPEIVADITDFSYKSALDIYQYLYDSVWADCSHRLLFTERPGDGYHMRDLAAATGSAIVWLDCTARKEQSLYKKFLGDMEPGKSACLGFYSTERSGITTASSMGISTIPADLFCNATVWASLDADIEFPVYDAVTPTVENKIYVAVYVSDGDNVQYCERAMRKIWDNSKNSRGKVAINWTISPALVDLAPQMMNYYYNSAKANDYFVCGPSGMGYTMPTNTLEENGAPAREYMKDNDKLASYVSLTERYLVRSGLRVITVWDKLFDDQREVYTANAPYLYGLTVQQWGESKVTLDGVTNGKYITQLTPCYESDYNALYGNVVNAIGRWKKDSPLFISCQISVWSLSVSDINRLYNDLNKKYGEGKVEFVRADEYFTLYGLANGLNVNLARLEGVTASATENAENASKVVDGSQADDCGWSFTESGAAVTVDLGAVCELSSYRLYFSKKIPKSWKVEVSADGVNFTAADSVSGEKESAQHDFPAAVSARYVRITFEKGGEYILTDLDINGKNTKS